MGSSFFLGTVAATTIGFFTLLRKFSFYQENKETDSSSSSSSPSSHLSSLSLIPKHDVFPSFRGEDVRKDFLSHIQKEFQRKGITPFIDNNIKRGESIGQELIQAIRGSKIAIVLLSRNYASSSWCLDELVEIMKCREEFGQTVIVIFYKVDPSYVKKLVGDFGKVFRNTCKGKRRENVERWREALVKAATIAGYDSSKWDNEANMIEKITHDISKILNYSTPSRDFDGLIGMEAHMKKIEPLLCIDSDEVRMIGIWGPPGIGKTTIARFLFAQHSDNFQLNVFMESIKGRYTIPACSDDYSAKLQLQQHFLSRITNQEDIQIPHLGVAQDRLNDKKVLVVLDDVNQSVQLDAMAKEAWWFGPKSRVIITTQNRRLLKAHGIKHIYEVDYPIDEDAFQMFCMYAFAQKSPYDGFEELARKVTKLSGKAPLGLKVMGSYFRGMSEQEWMQTLPRLKAHLDGKIESVLKFNCDALCDLDRDLFLRNTDRLKSISRKLEKKFLDVKQGLYVLVEKSLVSMENGFLEMQNLLQQAAIGCVGKQFNHKRGKSRFLVDAREICEVYTNDIGSRSVLGINLNYCKIIENSDINERAFEGMSNLQFLKFHGNSLKGYQSDTKKLRYNERRLHLLQGLKYLSGKLRLSHWEHFSLTSLPIEFHTEFLVKLHMSYNKLEKLFDGVQPLRNLKWMDLNISKNLKELPDLSTATNLQELKMKQCSSFVKLPSSIGNTTNLQEVKHGQPSSLKLSSSIGNAKNLQKLKFRECSGLVKFSSSIGNTTNLRKLNLEEC